MGRIRTRALPARTTEARKQRGDDPAGAFVRGPSHTTGHYQPCPGAPSVGGGGGFPARQEPASRGGSGLLRLGAGPGSAKRPAKLPWPRRQREGLMRGPDCSPGGAPATHSPQGSLASL